MQHLFDHKDIVRKSLGISKVGKYERHLARELDSIGAHDATDRDLPDRMMGAGWVLAGSFDHNGGLEQIREVKHHLGADFDPVLEDRDRWTRDIERDAGGIPEHGCVALAAAQ